MSNQKSINYIFPISYMSITQSMIAMVIGLSIFGKSELAAEIAVVHGATLATFYAFSGNFRNIILYGKGQVSLPMMLFSRLIILIPLAALAYFMCMFLAGIDHALALVLVVRRCVEWINEVHLCRVEVQKDEKFALIFLTLQAVSLLTAFGLILIDEKYAIAALSVWAFLPLLFSLRFIVFEKMPPLKEIGKALSTTLPHFGSTAIIGFSLFMFRLIIFLLTDKTMAGDIFGAIAVGSFMGSSFANVLGPSIALHEERTGARYFPPFIKTAICFILFIGLFLVTASFFQLSFLELTGKKYFFWTTAGFSLVGGVIMIKAQSIKLALLKHYENADIFGPDMLIHILLVASIPCLYFTGGVKSFSLLYLINSVLSLLFYMSAKRFIKDNESAMLLGVSDAHIKFGISFLLIFPLFFQLSGRIFHTSELVLNSDAIITQVPLPISIIACYAGLLALGRYKKAYMSMTVIFLLFVLTVLTTIIASNGQIAVERYKFLLLFQYMLPCFALPLGQLFESEKNGKLIVEKAFFFTILIIVPLQLLSTWISGTIRLDHSVFFFSIYQHWEFVPVILVSCFLVSLFSLWEYPGYRKGFFIMIPLVEIYAAASCSMLAFFIATAGLTTFILFRFIRYGDKKIIVALLCFLIPVAGYFYSARSDFHFTQKYGFLKEVKENFFSGNKISLNKKILPTNLNDRFRDWELYSDSIMTDGKTFLLGNNKPFDRALATSAHNFFLDFIYNFGFLAILPIFFLVGYSLLLAFKLRGHIFKSQRLLGLCMVVFFLILVDNNFKATFRQPYPGILIFFLWGLLLNRLMTLKRKIAL
ncbi:conserved membrane hypothetical protein [Candidatus Desulfarcum epimagneticum]|uniref:Uncharacterized protein n=1 Tax=uncultured Desulfobacteraceae bacterium TaxID=218296 RepID=A0A484HJ13_9BACT|nr:conserved membrane hypothetical protein [uncultured Desulfobacteraceae bacterium]